MKVMAFNGSPRKEGNTYFSLKKVCEELEREGVETEIIHGGGEAVRGCMACNGCVKNKNRRCVITEDSVNLWIEKFLEADGILLGSPVYFSGLTGSLKCALDRIFYVCSVNGSLLRHKAGASVAAVRRAGGIPALDQMNHYLLYSEIFIPGSSYWNAVYGFKPGEIEEDLEGLQTLKTLGKNMAYLLKMLQDSKNRIKPPEIEPKVYTHFIRKP